MKILFSRQQAFPEFLEEDFRISTIQEDIEKTRIALEIAYAGFDNATEPDMIDCYIYEINSLQKRYKHLTELSAKEVARKEKPLYQHSPVRALVSHVFG